MVLEPLSIYLGRTPPQTLATNHLWYRGLNFCELFLVFTGGNLHFFNTPNFLAGMGVWVCVVLGVRVPATSLFHDEKFAFFDLGVRGTPKILKIFLGVSPKILKKVGVLPAAAKVLPAAAKRLRPRGALKPSRRQAKLPLFSKFWTKPLRKFSKFWGTPNP